MTDEKIREIIDFVFPGKISPAIKSMNSTFDLDLASATQMAVGAACQSVKGARVINVDRNGLLQPANLFVHLTGASDADRNLLIDFFFGRAAQRQEEAIERHKIDTKQYKSEHGKYLRQLRKGGHELPRPKKPFCPCFHTRNSSLNEVSRYAVDNPEGVMWFLDESAYKRMRNRMGGAVGTLKRGYHGESLSIARDSQVLFIPFFTLAMTVNAQTGEFPTVFTQDDEDTGFLHRFVHILLPDRTEDERPRSAQIGQGKKEFDPAFLERTLGKLLDLRIYPDDQGDRVARELYFTREAAHIFNEWHRDITSHLNYGRMMPYVARFVENVMKMALGLHYMHLAAQCAELDSDIMQAEQESTQEIEKIDVERAIAISDIFLKKLEKFLRLKNKSSKVF